MADLLDVAWVADHGIDADDPDLPAPVAHRITLTGGVIACATWITASAGRRIPLGEARATASMCPGCWPAEVTPPPRR